MHTKGMENNKILAAQLRLIQSVLLLTSKKFDFHMFQCAFELFSCSYIYPDI